MIELAIIGGTGLTNLAPLQNPKREVLHTPYGEPSGPITYGELFGKKVVFLPRHGYGHTIPPHKINYRANIAALKEAGVRYVVAVAAVGGIRADMGPATLVIPDQIVDYTWNRTNTYFEEGLSHVTHIDFTEPYCADLRHLLIQAGRDAGVDAVEEGTYAATQGPRLETAAEVNRLERDGCHLVGMTGMPEAALARELDMCYATCAVVANWAAGRGAGEITMKDIEIQLNVGMAKVAKLMQHLVQRI